MYAASTVDNGISYVILLDVTGTTYTFYAREKAKIRKENTQENTQIFAYFQRQGVLTPLEPQSRFGDKVLEIRVECPQNGTAVLKGLTLPAPVNLLFRGTIVNRTKYCYEK